MARGNTNNAGALASSAATTNGTLVKGGSADISQIIATNTTASLKFLKIYNKRTAPVIGTDVPVLNIALTPNNVTVSIDIAGNMYFDQGVAFAVTGGAALLDATSVAAGDVVGINIIYS